MRVGFVGTGLAPLDGGGALERVTAAWAARLGELGHQTVLISPSQWETQAGARSLAERIAELRPELLVLANRPRLARLMPAPVLQIMHNWPDAWVSPGESPVQAGDLKGQHLAAVSPSLARHISATFSLGCPPLVVRPEVDPSFFEVIRDPEPGLVIVPSRLMEKKGIRLALETSEALGRGWRMVFFDYISPWRIPTAEHTRLASAIAAGRHAELMPAASKPTEMAVWYGRAQVVLVPSVHPEGLGMAALEAQAAGVPVVASAQGGLVDAIFRPNQVVEADPEIMARAILEAGELGDEQEPRAAVRALHGPEGSAATLGQAIGHISGCDAR